MSTDTQKILPQAAKGLDDQAQTFRELYATLRTRLAPILEPEPAKELSDQGPKEIQDEPTRIVERMANTIEYNGETMKMFEDLIQRLDV